MKNPIGNGGILLEGVHPDHSYIVQQLNQRRADPNFQVEVNLCDRNVNELVAYLADHGEET